MANDCKYNRIETVVSYDGGVSWESQTPPVYHRGTLIEPHSQDCETGSTLERWIVIEGDYLCDDNNRKYKKEMLENSYDGGVTWYPSNPTTFRLGQFVSVDVDFCSYSSESHYIIPDKSEGESCAEELSCRTMYMPAVVNGICTCVYVDPIKVIKCSTDTLTENNLSNGNYGLQTLKVGECTRVIDINENSSFANIFMRPYLTTIDTSKAVNLQIIDDGSFSFCDGIYRVAGQSFRKGDGLQSIVIPSGVTSIGDFAFYVCSAMTSVTIDDAPVTIGYSAFQGCSSLNTLDLGNNTIRIGEFAFQGCSSLTNVTIPDSVTSIGDNAFYDCYNLRNITCLATTPPTLDDDTVFPSNESIINVPCSSLYDYIDEWSYCASNGRLKAIPTSTCEIEPKYVFRRINDRPEKVMYCYPSSDIVSSDTKNEKASIVSAEIGSCTTSIRNRAFEGCTAMTGVTINNGVTTIENEAFSGCTSLISIEIPDSVTYLGGFRYCTSLTSATIPDSVTSIGYGAFEGCTSLTSVTINAATPPTLGSYAFANTNNCNIFVPCSSLSAYLSAWQSLGNRIYGIPPCEQPMKWIATYSDSHTESGRCDSSSTISGINLTNLVSVVIGNCATSLGNMAFYNCGSITSITIPDSVTSIGNSVFYRCSGLTSITIPNSVTSIGGGAFSYCTNIETIDIPSGVTTINNNTFSNCNGLTSVTIPDSVTIINSKAFQFCSSLGSVVIPSGVTSIEYDAFYNCSALASITCLATTPPALGSDVFYGTSFNRVFYVPAASVNTYKTASGWSSYADRIQPIT